MTFASFVWDERYVWPVINEHGKFPCKKFEKVLGNIYVTSRDRLTD